MKNFKKFNQALKENQSNLLGKAFDKKSGEFVQLKSSLLEQEHFFLKNGSFLSRIEAELKLFNHNEMVK